MTDYWCIALIVGLFAAIKLMEWRNWVLENKRTNELCDIASTDSQVIDDFINCDWRKCQYCMDTGIITTMHTGKQVKCFECDINLPKQAEFNRPYEG